MDACMHCIHIVGYTQIRCVHAFIFAGGGWEFTLTSPTSCLDRTLLALRRTTLGTDRERPCLGSLTDLSLMFIRVTNEE